MTVLEPSLAAGAAGGSGRWGGFFSLANGVTVLFLVVGGVFVYGHPVWRDEAQAFLLARDSGSPWGLIWNMRYEGHPPLWHLMLWVLTRVTVRVEAMQWLHLLLAGGSVYVVGRWSPFPWWIKIAFAFGYFPLFEYGGIARNYQLLLLLTVIICAVWEHRRFSFLTLGILLGLLSLTHVLGVILAASLGGMMGVDAVVSWAGRRAMRREWWRAILGVVIFGVMTWLAVKWVMVPADDVYAQGWMLRWNWGQAKGTLAGVWDVLVPVLKRGPHFWNDPYFSEEWFRVKWGLVIFGGSVLCMIASWRGVVVYVASAAGAFTFFYIKLRGSTFVRHEGVLFVALVAGFWIAWVVRGEGKKIWWRTGWWWMGRGAFFVLLCVQVYGAWVALTESWKYEFVPSKRAAELIAKNWREGDVLVSGNQVITAAVAAYLPGRAFYFVNGDRWGTYTIWDHWLWGEASEANILKFARKQKGRVIIVRCFSHQVVRGAKLLGDFPAGAEPMEQFSVQVYGAGNG